MDDLFGHVPQDDELPIEKASPTYDPYELVPDPTHDPDLPPVPRTHTKESIRRRMLAILEKAKKAESMPFTPRQLKSHIALFPYMAEWLEKNNEGQRLLDEFMAEVERLKAEQPV